MKYARELLIAALVVGAGFAVYHEVTGEDLQSRLDAANSRADGYELVAQNLRNDKGTLEEAYHELARQVTTEQELRQAAQRRSAALEEELTGVLQTLAEIETRVEAEADSSESTVEREGDVLALSLDERVYFDPSGHLRVSGRVEVQPATPEITDTDLLFEGAFPLTVVLSREENDDLSVTAYTGDPRLSVSQLDVIENVRDPLVESEREGFFDHLAGQLFDPGPWINRGVGAALMCLATCE